MEKLKASSKRLHKFKHFSLRQKLADLFAAQHEQCFYCDLALTKKKGEPDRDHSTFDHFVPRALGSPDSVCNIVLACYECNSKKGNRVPTEDEIDKWTGLARPLKHMQHVDWPTEPGHLLCDCCGLRFPKTDCFV